MKFGIRKPNYKARFKARTTGKLKRKMKKAVNPLYGKKGMGFIKNPKKSIKSSIYHRTTVGVPSLLPESKPKRKSAKPPMAAPVRNTSAPQPFIAKYSPKTYNACGILFGADWGSRLCGRRNCFFDIRSIGHCLGAQIPKNFPSTDLSRSCTSVSGSVSARCPGSAGFASVVYTLRFSV